MYEASAGPVDARLRVLSVTTLFPNAAMPSHGIFVENRLRYLAQRPGVNVDVIAPVPWFPLTHTLFGRYARFAAAPAAETRHGLYVTHPRFPVIPRFGMNLAPHLLSRAMEQAVRRHVTERGHFDIIDAHYYYPDGVAAVRVAHRLRKPVVVTARGSDINTIARFPRQKRMIVDAVEHADATITVSHALKDGLVAMGADADRIRVIRNGVDLETFHPEGREDARRRYGLTRPTVTCVANLVELKGHDLVLEAMTRVPDFDLLIAGDGPLGSSLRKQAARAGLSERVRFLGRVPHAELPELYRAADLLVLASRSEGWPNVLLEAMACGTPVVATPVGGIPEIVTSPAVGTIVPERTVEALATALADWLAREPDRAAVRRHAEAFSWDETTQAQIDLFWEILERRKSLSPAA